MKKANTSRKAKRISIRRYLPIGVRVHYDVVRNSAPVKMAGMGAMVLVGIFGVLLATQVVSPSSSASSTNEVTVIQAVPGVTVSKDSESSIQLAFSVDVSLAGGSLNNNKLDGDDAVKYYTSNTFSHTCSTSDTFYTQEAGQGVGVTLTAGGAHTATITDSVKVVCVRVKTKRNVYRENREGTIGHGFYSIAVNRSTTTQKQFTIADENQTGSEFSFTVLDSSNRRPTSVRYYRSSSSSLSECSSSSASYTLSASYETDDEVYQTTVSTASKNICLKVNYSQGNKTLHEIHGPFQVSYSASTITPIVVVDLNSNGQYVARNSNKAVTVTGWAYVFVPDEASCTGLRFLKPPPAVLEFRDDVERSNIWTPTAAEQANPPNRYICFSGGTASFTAGIGYKLINVNVVAVTPDEPDITITPSNNNRTYTATATGVVASSWQHVIKSSRACDSGDFSSSPLSGRSYTVLESAGTDQNGKYVCFKVRGSETNGVDGYASRVINVAAVTPDEPDITITPSNNNRTYTATATGVVASSWQHVIKSSRACDSGDFSSSPLSGRSYTVLESAGTDQNGKYVCFKVRGSETNGVDGYASRVINVAAVTPDEPDITITPSNNNRTYTATATGVVASSWQHVIKSSRACDSGDFSSSPLSGRSYTVLESAGTDQNGKYVCFKVRGSETNGVDGYASRVINVAAVTPDEPDITITPSNNNRTYTATATGVVASSWQHVIKSSRACDSGDFSSSPLSGRSYTVLESAGTDQNGKYVCFKVRGSETNGVDGYASRVINVAAVTPDEPDITITPSNNNRTYTATATGVVASSWQHVIKSSRACDSGDFSSSPLSGRSYTVLESAGTDQNGKYVCFKVRGSETNGVDGYASRVINVAAVTPDEPDITITPSNNNRTYTATATGVVASSWQHVIKSSRACDSGDFSSSPLSGRSYTVLESAGTDQNGKYVCFKVRGSETNGVDGYASRVINVTVEEVDQAADGIEDTAVVRVEGDSVAEAGKQDAADNEEEITKTGDGEERNWSQFAGYLLIAGAVLGIARVLIIKKYKQMG